MSAKHAPPYILRGRARAPRYLLAALYDVAFATGVLLDVARDLLKPRRVR